MASCAAEQGGWAAQPEELLMTVLDRLEWEPRASAAVRRTCSRFRRIHDAGCTKLCLRRRAKDERVRVLCARMPSLTAIDLSDSLDLTDEGLQHLRGLKQLTRLCLQYCFTSEGAERDLEWQRPDLVIDHLHDDP